MPNPGGKPRLIGPYLVMTRKGSSSCRTLQEAKQLAMTSSDDGTTVVDEGNGKRYPRRTFITLALDTQDAEAEAIATPPPAPSPQDVLRHVATRTVDLELPAAPSAPPSSTPSGARSSGHARGSNTQRRSCPWKRRSSGKSTSSPSTIFLILLALAVFGGLGILLMRRMSNGPTPPPTTTESTPKR